MQAILILYENRGKFFPLAKLALCTRIIIDGEKALTFHNLGSCKEQKVSSSAEQLWPWCITQTGKTMSGCLPQTAAKLRGDSIVSTGPLVVTSPLDMSCARPSSMYIVRNRYLECNIRHAVPSASKYQTNNSK